MSGGAVPRIVVVGTGTGVGKTWLSCVLLRRLRALGCTVLGLKPIESGVQPGFETDAQALTAAAGRVSEAEATVHTTSAPYRFPDPISPHLAAERADVSIELGGALTYVQDCESGISGAPRPVSIVETAGGLFSPLARGTTNFELARLLEPASWLLVAPDALGVLHDLTATLTAARALGRAPDALALCRARPADASTGTNADEVARLGIGPRPWVFPTDGDAGLDALIGRLLP